MAGAFLKSPSVAVGEVAQFGSLFEIALQIAVLSGIVFFVIFSRAMWTPKMPTTPQASSVQSVQQRSVTCTRKSRKLPSPAVLGEIPEESFQNETVQNPSENIAQNTREDADARWQGLKPATQKEEVSSLPVCTKYTRALLMMHREIQLVIARGPPGLEAPVPPGLGQLPSHTLQ